MGMTRKALQSVINMNDRMVGQQKEIADLRTDLETAVMHLRAILEQHGDASESLVQAERWLMSREVTK